MATYYNKAGDLIVLANTCMEKGKTKKALECMELALQMPDMQDIVAGLQQLNTVEANEIEDEEVEIDESCDDKNMDDEDIEESCGDDEVEDEVDIDVDTEDEEDPEEETASDEDEDIEEDEDASEGDDDDEDDAEEDEDIDEARLDEVLCSLRKQYNVTSSIKSSKTLGSRLAALASKAGK